jgi:hypothetical protein
MKRWNWVLQWHNLTPTGTVEIVAEESKHGGWVMVSDAEAEIEKARGQGEEFRKGYEAAARADERDRIVRELNMEGNRLFLKGPGYLAGMGHAIDFIKSGCLSEPKKLEHRTKPLSLTADDWNAMVDAVNELRAKI